MGRRGGACRMDWRVALKKQVFPRFWRPDPALTDCMLKIRINNWPLWQRRVQQESLENASYSLAYFLLAIVRELTLARNYYIVCVWLYFAGRKELKQNTIKINIMSTWSFNWLPVHSFLHYSAFNNCIFQSLSKRVIFWNYHLPAIFDAIVPSFKFITVIEKTYNFDKDPMIFSNFGSFLPIRLFYGSLSYLGKLLLFHSFWNNSSLWLTFWDKAKMNY